jgi:hypothetical protein
LTALTPLLTAAQAAACPGSRFLIGLIGRVAAGVYPGAGRDGDEGSAVAG